MADRPGIATSNIRIANILILGGTSEARHLAKALSGHPVRVITSLAGRTSRVPDLPGEIRIGGFGGAAGLSRYLAVEDIACLVDATHPFAESISRNATLACAEWQTPKLRLERPPWEPVREDLWHRAASLAEAARLITGLGRRVLLTVGSNDLAAFRDVTGPELLARMIEPPPPETLPAGCQILLERGPFDQAHEKALLSARKIDLIVTKNSGGNMTYAKLQAARELGIPVLMIDRPAPQPGPTAGSVAEALDWLQKKLDF